MNRALMFSAALLAGAFGPFIGQEAASAPGVSHSSRVRHWWPKLRNTRTTVAAMKRQARKRRNVRARRAK